MQGHEAKILSGVFQGAQTFAVAVFAKQTEMMQLAALRGQLAGNENSWTNWTGPKRSKQCQTANQRTQKKTADEAVEAREQNTFPNFPRESVQNIFRH